MQPGIGEEFIEKTKYQYLGSSDQQMRVPKPPLVAPFETGSEVIQLPDPNRLESELKAIIDRRASLRSFQKMPLSLGELSYLLWCTQGVKEVTKRPVTLRTVPSAGARHAFETYILANRVDGLTPGLYRFLALEHQIAPFILNEAISDQIQAACMQTMVAGSAAVFIWVAVVHRMTWRYHQRGYRYLFLDAGHVCQNLYLSAESIGCGACAIGAYDDDMMNELLHLDGKNEFVIYLAAVGKRAGGS